VIDINLEHPEYKVERPIWRQYQDMYVGGVHFKAHADQYLVPRQKEPANVYGERLLRVFYENYVGSIIDWYTATLFRREPLLAFDGANERGKRFFGELTEDCDLKGKSLTEFFREQMSGALVYGRSHILVDFPRSKPAVNRAEEDERGNSRAYLVGYSAEELINWSRDEHGNYEWVVLRSEGLRKRSIEDLEWVKETRWAYYDKGAYRIYEQTEVAGKKSEIQQVAAGQHGLVNQSRVPLFDLRLSDGLWLMNRAGLLQLEHFNKSNALSWALTMGLFSMPVVYSERPWSQIVGESYYIQLGPNDKFGWTEPEGKVFQIATDNLSRLQEEIYRVCYLSQVGGNLSGGHARSGLSKQRDFAVTQQVLRAYGDAVKDTLKRVLRAVEAAREDGLSIDVSGMDEFDIGDFATELDDAERLLKLGVNSPTLQTQVFKKLALKYLCDVRQEIKDQIASEIEAGPVTPGQTPAQ
jgi:hypothetical protein